MREEVFVPLVLFFARCHGMASRISGGLDGFALVWHFALLTIVM